MEAFKRYDLVSNYRCGASIEEMEQADEGEWVRYENLQPVLEAAKLWLDYIYGRNGFTDGTRTEEAVKAAETVIALLAK